jgi:hypothetical protein
VTVNGFQPLIDQLYREEVRKARAMKPEERFRVGMEICEANFRWARTSGEAEMNRRYAIMRKLDDQGCSGPPVPRL